MKIPVTSYDRRVGTRRDQLRGFRKSKIDRATAITVLLVLWVGILLGAIAEASR